MNEKKESGAVDKITDFIQKNRKGIFICTSATIILAAGLIVFFALSDYLNKKAIAESEELSLRFEKLRGNLEDESYSEEINALYTDLETFAKNNSGLAAARVYSFIARIHSSRKDWALCEETWRSAAKIGDKTYMAPIALFNIGAALEEQGKVEESIEYLKKSIEHPFEFPAAPRAQFNIGRLYEKLGNNQAAIEAYREVLINWPNIPIWQHLARSRIIALEIEG